MSKTISLDEERKKKQKKKLIMNIICVITVIYIIYAIYLIVKTPTDTVTVESGTLTLEESATGYIIRDETVVQGDNYKNGIYPIVLEGERTAKKQTIFRYYGKSEEELQEKINDIDLKIQDALEKENTFSSTDIKNLEGQIDDEIVNLQNKTDLQEIAESKKEISDIILKKATIAGKNSKSGSYIQKLINQREAYQKQLTNDSEYVVSPTSGVVSYRVDGLENVLTPAGIKNLSVEDLEQLDVKTGKIVTASDESAKVIDNFKCYIATVLNSDISDVAKEGQSVKITLSGGTEVSATIESIKTEGDRKIISCF